VNKAAFVGKFPGSPRAGFGEIGSFGKVGCGKRGEIPYQSLVTSATSEPHLHAANLQQAFQIGKTRIEVLRNISLSIMSGETIFLCGASGAGKTTLLYTLAGLERPRAGRIRFEGEDIYALNSDRLAGLRNRRMGFIFQSYFLLPELTALENVVLPSMIGGRARHPQAIDLLERVGLKDRLQHLPSELSGGEQQRVAIARSLINDPSILYADEPTGNLDSHTGEAIIELLLEVARQAGRTLIVVTHDEQLAKRGDRLLRIEDGSLSG
jgi:putative ABC transport system ATP-binding protein/lipoprotein-releasing system ATP-binding protein